MGKEGCTGTGRQGKGLLKEEDRRIASGPGYQEMQTVLEECSPSEEGLRKGELPWEPF